MTLKECYDAFGGDYAEVTARLRNEERVIKFIGMFLKDESFANLEKALKENNLPEAFRAAHTLKGICGNLSFTRLHRSSHGLTELLRGAKFSAEIPLLFDVVKKDYELAKENIQNLLRSM